MILSDQDDNDETKDIMPDVSWLDQTMSDFLNEWDERYGDLW